MRRIITGAASFGEGDVSLGTADTLSSIKAPAPASPSAPPESSSEPEEALSDDPPEEAADEADTVMEAATAEATPEPAEGDEASSSESPSEEAESEEESPEGDAEEHDEAQDEADTSSDEEASDAQVRFNLEADFDNDSGHNFFCYDDDGDEDLPGLFIASSNLLKEDREVRVALSLAGAQVQLKGIVAWRREEADGEGPAGMGIEITWLGPGAPEALGNWLAENTPITV